MGGFYEFGIGLQSINQTIQKQELNNRPSSPATVPQPEVHQAVNEDAAKAWLANQRQSSTSSSATVGAATGTADTVLIDMGEAGHPSSAVTTDPNLSAKHSIGVLHSLQAMASAFGVDGFCQFTALVVAGAAQTVNGEVVKALGYDSERNQCTTTGAEIWLAAQVLLLTAITAHAGRRLADGLTKYATDGKAGSHLRKAANAFGAALAAAVPVAAMVMSKDAASTANSLVSTVVSAFTRDVLQTLFAGALPAISAKKVTQEGDTLKYDREALLRKGLTVPIYSLISMGINAGARRELESFIKNPPPGALALAPYSNSQQAAKQFVVAFTSGIVEALDGALGQVMLMSHPEATFSPGGGWSAIKHNLTDKTEGIYGKNDFSSRVCANAMARLPLNMVSTLFQNVLENMGVSSREAAILAQAICNGPTELRRVLVDMGLAGEQLARTLKKAEVLTDVLAGEQTGVQMTSASGNGNLGVMPQQPSTSNSSSTELNRQASASAASQEGRADTVLHL